MNCWNKEIRYIPHLQLCEPWSILVVLLVAVAKSQTMIVDWIAQQRMEVLMGKINQTKRNGLISTSTVPIRRVKHFIPPIDKYSAIFICKCATVHCLLTYASLPSWSLWNTHHSWVLCFYRASVKRDLHSKFFAGCCIC